MPSHQRLHYQELKSVKGRRGLKKIAGLYFSKLRTDIEKKRASEFTVD